MAIAAPEARTPVPVRSDAPNVEFPHCVTDPTRVPVGRYTDPEFARLEAERLWKKAWQMACRLDEIPRVGDYVEYEVAGQSVLVVRETEAAVKAYFNACRHRATALGTGSGSFPGKQIVCPYHGWRWNLDGSNSYVYAKQGFTPACLDSEFLKLRECQVGVLLGMVFISLDVEAPPLEDALGDIAAPLETIGFDRMQVRWWRHVVLPANWKIAQEAFMEAYHVMQAHPSLAMGAADDDYDLDALGAAAFEPLESGSTHALPVIGTKSPIEGMSMGDYLVQFNNALYFGTDAYATERDQFIQQGLMEKGISGDQFPFAFFGALYEYAQGAGIPLPPPSEVTSGYAHVFPNLTVLPAYGNSIVYRVRPDGDNPESCIFEVWALQIPPDAERSDERPQLEGPIPIEEWPQIFKEDFRNIVAQQKGLHTEGMEDLVLSEAYEAMIVNHHRALDTYLAGS